MKTNHVQTDGGRAGFSATERKDCTVRALSCSTGLSYKTAHAMLAAMGRKPGQGFRFYFAALKLGFKEHVQPKRGQGRLRVKTALKKYSKGRFVFRICRHVFAVVDGVSYDRLGFEYLENRIVTTVWETEQLTEPQTSATVAATT